MLFACLALYEDYIKTLRQNFRKPKIITNHVMYSFPNYANK